MNCFSPSTVIPLLRTPLTVGKRGSSLVAEMRREETNMLVKMRKAQKFVGCHQKVAEAKDLGHSSVPR